MNCRAPNPLGEEPYLSPDGKFILTRSGQVLKVTR
jgi:hypothetical protein